MITTETEVTRTLGPEASARVLAQAWQVGVDLRLRNLGTGMEAVCVTVNSDDVGTTLTVKVGAGAGGTGSIPTGADVVAELILAGRRYAFQTRCLEPPSQALDDLLRMERPKVVTVIERRRSRRREFQESTEVMLQAADGDASWQNRGTLLNLSMDGMACRIRAEDTMNIAVGSPLRVTFSPSGSLCELAINARVINVTRGASPGRAIVGMEFTDVESPSFPREVLRNALAGTG